MSDFTKTQWHPPFCAAVKLELRANKKDLSFDSERVLNTKPIQLDLLVIKKLQFANIQNEIGKIFRGHNIFEYKSPEDTMNIDAYFKTLSYACIYKANSPTADGIKADDITVSLVHEGTPVKLINWFKDNDCNVTEQFPGIYYVTGIKALFPTQIIVSSKLGAEEHEWLKSLTSKMNREIGERLVLSANNLSDKDDKENADSVIQLALAENPNLFKQLKEVPEVCEALNTLMKPELDAAWSNGNNAGIAKGRAEGRAEGKAEGMAEGRAEGMAKGMAKGMAEGRAEGATELATAIIRLNRGDTAEKLISEGFSKEIVNSAKEVINEL